MTLQIEGDYKDFVNVRRLQFCNRRKTTSILDFLKLGMLAPASTELGRAQNQLVLFFIIRGLNILRSYQLWVPKHLWDHSSWVSLIFGGRHFLGFNNFWGNKSFGINTFWGSLIFGGCSFLAVIKYWGNSFLGGQKCVGSTFLGIKHFWE